MDNLEDIRIGVPSGLRGTHDEARLWERLVVNGQSRKTETQCAFVSGLVENVLDSTGELVMTFGKSRPGPAGTSAVPSSMMTQRRHRLGSSSLHLTK